VTQDEDGPVAALSRHFGADVRPGKLAVAISGGSDSTALLLATREWAALAGVTLVAVTVDHGLRSEAVDEAAHVAALCSDLGVPHDTLRWTGWDGKGNLQDAARRARYTLMSEWAGAQGLDHVLLGHTADDQAETLMMRLARQAGLDGLAGMAPRARWGDVTLHRPFLHLRRDVLRAFLRERGIGWIDDPSNEDTQFRRVRIRQALTGFEECGLSVEGLAKVAGHLREARETLGVYAVETAQKITRFDRGDIVFDRAEWAQLRADMRRRLLQAALRWVSGADYGARGRTVEDALFGLSEGCDTVLHGCRVMATPQTVRITREAQAVVGAHTVPGEIWDGRWRVTGPAQPGDTVRHLGEAALGLCPDRAESGLPAASLVASPSVWRDEMLVAAPLAGLGEQWSAELLRSEHEYHDILLSH